MISRLLDKAVQCENTRGIVCTDFLDPYQKSVVERVLSNLEDPLITFEGGYAGAERVIVIFRPDFILEDEIFEQIPFTAIHINLLGRGKLTHRDYLGSILGLGIKREKIGDILVKEDGCSVLAMKEMTGYIVTQLSKVGNIRVKAEVCDLEELQEFEPKVKEINTTVASLRLDCVAGAGFCISRSKISEYIRAEKVQLNWEMTENVSKPVKDGDTISIRGRGRVVVEKVKGITKKGRVSIELKRLL